MTNIFDEEKNEITPVVTESTPDGQSPELTDSEIAAERQKMYDEVTQKIPTAPLHGELKVSLDRAVEALHSLKQEIAEKKQGAIEKRQLIREKVMALCDSGKVNVDASEFEKSDVSVQEFVALLDRMIEEVDTDYVYYKELASDQPPVTMIVFKVERSGFEEVIKERIEMIKRYVKTARRDLAVSYSRYCYGFEAQIRQILFVEQVLMKKN